jgi:HAD superfamily hydrolase (TIGR01549 family)
MTSFSKFKVILWDFDGVLMDSMPVRDKGFELVLRNFPGDQLDQLMKYHRANGGLSRYVKFRYFFEQIRKETISDNSIMALATEFSVVMRRELTDASLLINDSLDFVKRNCKTWPMHIVSGSDGEELNYLCKTLEIDQYFKSIHGSPTPKKQLIAKVLESYNQTDCILIGDSINDYDAATANGISFCGYNNENLRGLTQYYVNSFSNVG